MSLKFSRNIYVPKHYGGPEVIDRRALRIVAIQERARFMAKKKLAKRRRRII